MTTNDRDSEDEKSFAWSGAKAGVSGAEFVVKS